jgi:hypothetical protein
MLAGDEGFEPPMTGPEPVALPLGQSPISRTYYITVKELGIGVLVAWDPSHP